MKLLIAAKANVNTVARDMQNTALHVAASHGQTDVILVLIAAGAKVNVKNLIGSTPYKFAVEYNHPEAAEALKKAGGHE